MAVRFSPTHFQILMHLSIIMLSICATSFAAAQGEATDADIRNARETAERMRPYVEQVTRENCFPRYDGANATCGNPAPSRQQLNCLNNRGIITTQMPVLANHLNDLAVDHFFSEIQANTRAQAQCQVDIINHYESNADAHRQMNQTAEQRFNAVARELRALKEELAEVNRQYAPFTLFTNSPEGQRRKADLEAQKERLEDLIDRLLHSIPLSYEAGVLEALDLMASRGAFDVEAYERAVVATKAKYEKSLTLISRGMHTYANQAGESFCTNQNFRNAAIDSGQASIWLQNYSDPLLRRQIECRMNVGRQESTSRENRNNAIALVLGLVPYVGQVPKLFKLVRATAFFSRADAVVDLANAATLMYTMDRVRASCFGMPYIISGASRTCNVNSEFEHSVIDSRSINRCAVRAGFALTYAPWAREIFRRRIPNF